MDLCAQSDVTNNRGMVGPESIGCANWYVLSEINILSYHVVGSVAELYLSAGAARKDDDSIDTI